RPAHPWERFSAKLESTSRPGPIDQSEAALSKDHLPGQEGDGSETEPPTEPPSEAEDRPQVSAKVLLSNFPVSWLALEVRPQLDARISALLT
ncbi:unnamed protein product, partial [Symbiodinium pilosum]